MEYFYDATGIKLKKKVTQNSNTTITNYAGNYVYEDNGFTEELKFFNHPEGYVEPDGTGFKYVYRYSDHLGNTRLLYADHNKNGIITTDEVIEEHAYYPFGMIQKRSNNVVSASSNSVAGKFKYNGTELEEGLGLNLYEMPLRRYDPTIARWTSIDPITHFSNSTYNGYDNNPIFFADPSGAEVKVTEGGNNILFTGEDAVSAFKMIQNSMGGSSGGSSQDPDAKEVVKQTRETLKNIRGVSKKVDKAFNAIDGFYSLGAGATPQDQTKALQDVYNSLGGLLPRNVSFKIFAQYYDIYLAMVNYQLKVIEQGLRQRSLAINQLDLQNPLSDGHFHQIGAFAGGVHVYRYMQQIKQARETGNGGNLVNINNKVINFVYKYQRIIEFTTGQSLPTMYATAKGSFKVYSALRGDGSALDYQTAEYFLSNFNALEKMLYGGQKVQN